MALLWLINNDSNYKVLTTAVLHGRSLNMISKQLCLACFVFKQADILVCSVGSNIKLSIGAVARAMSQAAGPKLQDALINATKNHLSQGEVVHTISGNLPCNHVMFCVCCPWDDGKGDAKQVRYACLG